MWSTLASRNLQPGFQRSLQTIPVCDRRSTNLPKKCLPSECKTFSALYTGTPPCCYRGAALACLDMLGNPNCLLDASKLLCFQQEGFREPRKRKRVCNHLALLGF